MRPGHELSTGRQYVEPYDFLVLATGASPLRHRGLEVTLVEELDQVMAVLDREMARQLEDHLEAHGTRVLLSSRAAGFADADGRVVVDLGGEQIAADIVILAVGVRPIHASSA